MWGGDEKRDCRVRIDGLRGGRAVQAQTPVDALAHELAHELPNELALPQGVFARMEQVDLAHMPGNWQQHPGLSGTLYPFQDAVSMGFDQRRDSAIDYLSPTLHGLSVRAIYRSSEAPFNSAAYRSYGATLGYARGPVTLSISDQRKRNVIETAVPGIDNAARDVMVAANVHVGVASAYAALGQHKGGSSVSWSDATPYGAMLASAASTDTRDVLIGFALAYGSTVLMISHGRRDDRNAANLDLTRFAIGITHRWSRQTDFYAVYAKISNISSNTFTPGRTGDAGRGGAFNIGLRFGF
jgi:predicted porin